MNVGREDGVRGLENAQGRGGSRRSLLEGGQSPPEDEKDVVYVCWWEVTQGVRKKYYHVGRMCVR